jgi:hypothetical protein
LQPNRQLVRMHPSPIPPANRKIVAEFSSAARAPSESKIAD